MSPLVVMILLLYGLLITFSLTLWAALTLSRPPAQECSEADAEPPEAPRNRGRVARGDSPSRG